MLRSGPAAATSWASRRTRECGDCFDIARQIDGHTRRPAMLYLTWKSRKSSVGIDATCCLKARLSTSVTGKSVPWLSHWLRGRSSQVGPRHQSVLFTSSWRGTPRLAKSAGLCSDWTCDQLAASVDSVIYVTLLATNVVAGLASHASGESVQQWSFEVSLGILERTASAVLDNYRTPHRFSLGSETVLTGTTRVLTVSKCTMVVRPISTRT